MAFRVSIILSLVLLLLASRTHGQCSIDPYDRSDCGLMNQQACEAGGCCWNPTWEGGPAWCFYPEGVEPSLPHANTYVHLFEWRWPDVALECENYLGPNGFDGVQVSPPNEHRVIYSNGERPWWERYQPVSYQLVSRGGTRAEFADMVKRCNAAGVEVYVDAVINHMSGLLGQSQRETGSGGSSFGYYDYPDFKYANFHHNPDFSGQGNCQINQADYQNNAWRVRNCDLSGLTDLDTDAPYVQQVIGKYLNDLVNLGVKGFRVDAAKHMDPSHIQGILAYIARNSSYVYQEVIDLGSEAVKYEDYLYIGSLCEFLYGARLSDVFRNGKLSSLNNFGEAWGFIRSDKAQAFIENHDNERGHGAGGNVLTFNDGRLYELANVYMLAWPYGYAQVMSSYRMRNTDHSGPSTNVWQNGRNTCFDSGSQWVCQHRWDMISKMVPFRAAVRGEPVSYWWSNGSNQIAFSRGNKGFVAINRESFSLNTRIRTGLPSGTYCELIHSGTGCSSVTVDGSGYVQVNIGSMDTFVLQVK